MIEMNENPNSTLKCAIQSLCCCCYKRFDENEIDFECCLERSYSLISDNTEYICACNALICHNVLYSLKPFVCQLCYITTYNYKYPKRKYQISYKIADWVCGIGLHECLLCSNVEI